MNTLSPQTIGVVIPAWNRAEFLPLTVASVMGQSRPPDAVVIVDDGSTDATPAVIKEMRSRWPQIQAVRTENKGPAHARNAGVKALPGVELLAFCDSDDLWEPSKLEKQVQVFQTGPFDDLGCVYCGNDNIDEHGERIAPPTLPRRHPRGRISRWMLCGGPVLGSMSAVVIRKSFFDQLEGFNEALRSDEDFEFFVRLAQVASFDYHPDCLVRIRLHDGASSADAGKLLASKNLIFSLHSEAFSWASQFVHSQRREFLRLAFPEWNDLSPANKLKTLLGQKDQYTSKASELLSGKGRDLIAPPVWHWLFLFPLFSVFFPIRARAREAAKAVRNMLRLAYCLWGSFGLRHLGGLSAFLRDLRAFNQQAEAAGRAPAALQDIFPVPGDATATVDYDSHYLYHTAWAARHLAATRPEKHVDIGSLLMFSAIASAFCPISHYDYRRPDVELNGLQTGTVDLVDMPFADESIASLSCMHVVEHIGLGRYGDALQASGDLLAMKELERVLAPGGNLFFVVPVGRSRVCFHAHRVYDADSIIAAFPGLRLVEFSLISGKRILGNPPAHLVMQEEYGCGCFFFQKIS
ncbi:MAG: glycosyltransferase [Desulfovibrio sp.]|jgi:glycosyltransferase involved in cell wall biosynthesis|nr:glycosyltransferase [Desulfovibrio sp.]